MPTNRTPVNRRRIRQLSPEVIATWTACDFHALHRALGLGPADSSPLPYEVTALGVGDDDDLPLEPNHPRSNGPWARSLKTAVTLQRQLLRIAGWPDCRKAYEEKSRGGAKVGRLLSRFGRASRARRYWHRLRSR